MPCSRTDLVACEDENKKNKYGGEFVCVYIFSVLSSCSASSNPPATLSEEIIHCQY